jgi:hypothetical protein
MCGRQRLCEYATGGGEPPCGMYRDRLITASRVVIDRGWHSNVIVDRARLLIAGFMRGDAAAGIRRLLIGRGDAGWDTSPEGPARTAQELVDPAPFELTLASPAIAYVNAAGDVTQGPTNRLRLAVTLGANEPSGDDPYPLREFGLFGEFDGDSYMINYVRHRVIHKPADATLVRTIQLVF